MTSPSANGGFVSMIHSRDFLKTASVAGAAL
ncbi:MAG: twin-arginine translocation signal domain-containing protein, partial [Pedosphaera sp.]|nr:twin-arginine translocation signal domain-containing protein [Pedosphaera sp.]